MPIVRPFAIAGLAACLLLGLPGTVERARGQGAPTLRAFVNGNGTIVGSGVNCGAKGSLCGVSYALGTTITIEAIAERYSVFAGWSGACTGTAPTCMLEAGTPTVVTASFSYIEVIDVNKSGDGQGTVTSLPDGINCGSSCSVPFTGSTKVVLTAAAAAGSVFAGWSGACGGTGPCELQQSYGTLAVTAKFDLKSPGRANTGPKTPTKKTPATPASPKTATAFTTKNLGGKVRKTGYGHEFIVKMNPSHASLLTLELYRGGTKVLRSKPFKLNPGAVTIRLPLKGKYPAGTYQIYASLKSIQNKRSSNLKWIFTLR